MDTPILSDLNLLDLTMRLSIAIIAGSSIGLDRYIHHQAAGLRSHLLVCLGSALTTIVPTGLVVGTASQHENHTYLASLGRITQGIAAGVVFLGAGKISHPNPVRVASRNEKPQIPNPQSQFSTVKI